MSLSGTILVGTVGQGVFRSADDGQSWLRAGPGQGMHSDAIVRCLAVHPRQEGVVLAGTDQGLYRSEDAGASWRKLQTALDGRTVWSLVIDDERPDIILAGTGTPSPPGLYRSEDGGASWQQGKAQIADTCPAVGIPRPTAIAIDPTDRQHAWAGIEVDGVRRSRDGGRTWESAAEPIRNPDVHNLLITNGVAKRIFVLVNDDIWISEDDGESWRSVGVRQSFAFHYPRGIAARPDSPETVFVTLGDTTPGRTGVIMRSRDGGRSWQGLPLPGQPNSAMWTLTIPRAAPDLMFAASRYGYLYRSNDGGDSWQRLWREFSEVSSLAWLPA